MFVASQYDIIYLFFMLKAFDNYLKGDMWRFTAWMAVAVPVKSLAVFLFPALLLYKEKKCASDLPAHRGAVSAVAFCFSFCFRWGRKWRNLDNILVIFGQKLVFRKLEIPIFLLAIIVLYITCYALKAPEDEKKAGINSVRALRFVLCAVFHLVQYQSVLVYSSAAVSMHSDCTECGQKVSEHDSRNHHLDLLCRYVCVADSMVL